MYNFGHGVPQDHAEAAKWYRLATEQGVAAAQIILAAMYFKGEGLPQDYITAHMWSNIAAANGRDKAGEFRETLAAKMTPADISAAQSRARACMASDYQDCD